MVKAKNLSDLLTSMCSSLPSESQRSQYVHFFSSSGGSAALISSFSQIPSMISGAALPSPLILHLVSRPCPFFSPCLNCPSYMLLSESTLNHLACRGSPISSGLQYSSKLHTACHLRCVASRNRRPYPSPSHHHCKLHQRYQRLLRGRMIRRLSQRMRGNEHVQRRRRGSCTCAASLQSCSGSPMLHRCGQSGGDLQQSCSLNPCLQSVVARSAAACRLWSIRTS